MPMDNEESERRTDFWMKVAATTFGLWALAIPLAAVSIREAIRDIGMAQAGMEREFRAYVLQATSQTTLLKERQDAVIAKLQRLEDQRNTEKR